MAEQILVVKPHSEYIGKGCPTCHHGIEEGQTIAICPRCKSVHHEKCWFDQGGCGKVGCTGVSSKRRDTTQSESAATNNGSAPAAAAAANPDIKPVSTQANQMPIGAILAVVAVVVIIALYFILR